MRIKPGPIIAILILAAPTATYFLGVRDGARSIPPAAECEAPAEVADQVPAAPGP